MKTFNLDTPIMVFNANTKNETNWTIRQAVEGVQIFGGIGSGKTSGSGRMLALKYLQNGFGGIVLTVKPDEKDLWVDYCKEAGRSDDLLIIEPGCPYQFNFLNNGGNQGNLTENIVDVLKTVIRASEEKASGKGEDPFWESALDMLLFNVVDLCRLAYGKVSVQEIYNIAQSLPKSGITGLKDDPKNAFYKAFTLAKAKVQTKVAAWEQDIPHNQLAELKKQNTYDAALFNTVADARVLNYIDQFFLESFLNLHEKTRSIIDFSLTGFLFRLLREPILSLFCANASNFQPEDSLRGKIILINLPVKLYQKVGRDCQILFKYIWQKSMEKRNIEENDRPVFLWADEAQNFIHEHDADYQATARSSRIATVYISQNLPNYYANMGGGRAEQKVKSFLGTLNTKIFHANADVDTNRYASEYFGDVCFEETSSTSTAAGQFSASRTKSIKFDRMIRPEQFNRLRTGGEQNAFMVEGYIHLQGNVSQNGNSDSKIKFNQKTIVKL